MEFPIMFRNCFVVFLMLSLLPGSASGFSLYEKGDFALTLKGYYKNLYFTSERQATGAPFHAELNRVRTEWEMRAYKILAAKVAWDNELIAGNYVATEEFALRQTQRNVPYPDLDYELARRENFFYGQGFYRATARVDAGPVVFVGGRQKVDWGVMRLISPADLFTRLPIFDIERDERVGVTAANVEISPGFGIKINPVYAVQPDFDRSRIGGRVTKTVGRFDLSAMGGRFLRDALFGFDFAGEIRKAGVRGEFVFDRADVGDDFVQLAAGVDYGFENSFYFALEYFFNGQGTNDPLTITPFPATANQIKTVHENFIGLQIKYDLTPLWTAMVQGVVDLNGGSLFINPESRYSLFSWLEITGGAQIPVGKGGGEFMAVPNAYYFETQIFF